MKNQTQSRTPAAHWLLGAESMPLNTHFQNRIHGWEPPRRGSFILMQGKYMSASGGTTHARGLHTRYFLIHEGRVTWEGTWKSPLNERHNGAQIWNPISARYGRKSKYIQYHVLSNSPGLEGALWHQQFRQVVPFPSVENKTLLQRQ